MPVELLTAQFSRPEYGLALLERAEVARIAREQNLMAGNSAGFARLGNLLGAHGVLVLDVFEQKQTTNITVKLVAVRSGVVVGFQSYPWPLEELSEWPTLVGRQFKALFPKVDVLAGDAVPISVLNLRSPISTSEATVLTTPAEGAVKKQA